MVASTVFCRKTLDTAAALQMGTEVKILRMKSRVHLAVLGQSPSPLGQPQQLSSLRQCPVGQIANSVLRPTAFIACIHNHHPIHALPLHSFQSKVTLAKPNWSLPTMQNCATYMGCCPFEWHRKYQRVKEIGKQRL